MKKKALAVQQPAKSAKLIEFDRVEKIKKRKTPRKHIDVIRGFDYVKIGYVRRLLDEAYPGRWEVDTDEMIGGPGTLDALSKLKEVVLKVTLSAFDEVGNCRKMVAYGGGAVRFVKSTGAPLGLADNFKTAEADGLKKAASLMGFCSDIYEPVVEARQDEDQAEAKVFATGNLEPNKTISDALSKAFIAKVQSRGVADEVSKVLGELGIQKLSDLTNEKFEYLYGKVFSS